MTTPQNNVKSVSVLDLEDFVINLEQAENLLFNSAKWCYYFF